ncbi:MAG: imidazole glycerol phosphate synthase subunit HisF [Candidatus Dormibacteria bacterium]
MLAKRILPCLDVAAGRVVKGRRFQSLRDQGDPVLLARRYADEGADELVFLDIEASLQGRGTMVDLVSRVARELFIPLTVGGGIRSESDIRLLLRAGADKVAIQSAAVGDPELVQLAATSFGSQCVVVAIDARRHQQGWEVFTHGARRPTGLDAVSWAHEVERRGAGELLVTSIDQDGVRGGYDVELTRAISDTVQIPVIASGGAGTPDDLLEVLTVGHADAALAASIFHSGDWTVAAVKERLHAQGVAVRL